MRPRMQGRLCYCSEFRVVEDRKPRLQLDHHYNLTTFAISSDGPWGCDPRSHAKGPIDPSDNFGHLLLIKAQIVLNIDLNAISAAEVP